MHAAPHDAATIGAARSRTAWDAGAAALVADAVRRWDLTVEHPLDSGFAGVVTAVVTADGTPAVLKVGYPHVEGVWEPVGLAALGSGLAPALFDQHAPTWTLLMERLEPAERLDRAVDAGLPIADAVAVGADVLARVVRRALPVGVPTLAATYDPFFTAALRALDDDPTVAAGADPAHLVAAWRDALALSHEPVPVALVHGDANPTNVLRGGRGWRVVDPKPMVGDPAFDPAPLVAQLAAPGDPDALGAAVVAVAREIGLDPRRVARWGVARAALDVHWYGEDGDPDAVAGAVSALAAWRALLAD